MLAVAVGDRLHPGGAAALTAAGGRVLRAADGGPVLGEAAGRVLGADLVLDAVLGTGARGGLRGPAAELVRSVLDRWPGDGGPAVVACDVPSGVSADTGAVVLCPYCAQAVQLTLDPGGGASQDYVEDCEVCCQPWRVRVRYDADGAADVQVIALDD